jgi:hypothetical protein
MIRDYVLCNTPEGASLNLHSCLLLGLRIVSIVVYVV